MWKWKRLIHRHAPARPARPHRSAAASAPVPRPAPRIRPARSDLVESERKRRSDRASPAQGTEPPTVFKRQARPVGSGSIPLRARCPVCSQVCLELALTNADAATRVRFNFRKASSRNLSLTILAATRSARGLQSSFCFAISFDPAHRCFNPALAGGALLDIGIYNLTMTRWALRRFSAVRVTAGG